VEFICIISNKPTTTTEEFDAFSRFHVNKNIKQTYKGGLQLCTLQ